MRLPFDSYRITAFFDALAARIRPRRLRCYRRCIPLFKGKIGLEIGGPSSVFKLGRLFPVYAVAGRVDNCNLSHRASDPLYRFETAIEEGRTFRYSRLRAPGVQYVMEAADLSRIAPASYDFVLSSHALEHVANPLRALSEWTRVLREGGHIVLVLPHKDGTFDHRRPVTTLAHMVADFERRVSDDDATHMDEILRLHDLARTPEYPGIEDLKQATRENPVRRRLHHHVFDTRLAVETVHHMGLQILSVEVYIPHHILIVARKPGKSEEVRNDPFRGIGAAPVWKSPFPSDR
ncbi:MAG: class I SAM-dependent methyltransferase [Thermodesulfobacteriota bacterium]